MYDFCKLTHKTNEPIRTLNPMYMYKVYEYKSRNQKF